jgi:hypothetical protein
MRTAAILPLLLLFSSSTASFSGPTAPLPHRRVAPPRVSDLSWLEGSWLGRIGGRDFEAHYTSAEGGQILSASKYTEDGKPAGFEFERFEQKGDTLVLTPFPEGNSSATFPLVEYDARNRRAVFENVAHDFPTRISYQRVSNNRLTILVSGPAEDGKEQVLTYALEKRR